MHPSVQVAGSPAHRLRHTRRPRRWFLGIVFMIPLTSLGNTGREPPGGTEAPKAYDSFRPPHLADATHVLNGCYVSAAAYLARFLAAFPGERGEVVTVLARSGDGRRKPHSIAVITWQGEWWLRDEYYGVAALRLPVSSSIGADRLETRALAVCEKNSVAAVTLRHAVQPQPAPAHLSREDRLAEVLAAASLLPVSSEVFWVEGDGARVPMLFFLPRPGWIGVYEPCHGTALAESNSRDGMKVIPLVAARLGYAVDTVRRHLPAALAPTLLATDVR